MKPSVHNNSSLSTLENGYAGSGTADDPYLVEWLESDPANPQSTPTVKGWWYVSIAAIAAFAVNYTASTTAGAIPQIQAEFGCSQPVAMLTVAMLLLGFLASLIVAPMSEEFGRRLVLIVSMVGCTVFTVVAAVAPNIASLVVFRFFTGVFGASSLTMPASVLSDVLRGKHRGIAMTICSCAPFAGPALSPVFSNLIAVYSWRWALGVDAILCGLCLILTPFLPETYGPLLLMRRARMLQHKTGHIYTTRYSRSQQLLLAKLRVVLARPWQLLLYEGIVFILAIYVGIIYGTLFMLFGSLAIVYHDSRGWPQQIQGLPFLAVIIGTLVACIILVLDEWRFARVSQKHNGHPPAEARLPLLMVAAVCLPVGLFWFAWTNSPDIYWLASVSGIAVFSCGIFLVFVPTVNYLIACYELYAASALSACFVVRTLTAVSSTLYSRVMFENLGLHWAASIPAFLALLCAPFPFIFYKVGARIRAKSRFGKIIEVHRLGTLA